uniref:Uncharacterized protein n=1 Tax=Candidatus Kentrum sp. FM TaxID=2126340 RepID=A0A450U358_9GAMM|nr:MAG: hypothetical protein BECKFM1743C_GA0114222_110031 [Candidatus Kentron sp. FM]
MLFVIDTNPDRAGTEKTMMSIGRARFSPSRE